MYSRGNETRCPDARPGFRGGSFALFGVPQSTLQALAPDPASLPKVSGITQKLSLPACHRAFEIALNHSHLFLRNLKS